MLMEYEDEFPFVCFLEIQKPSVMFQGVCSIFMVMSWFDNKTKEGGGGRGPNRPRGRANGEQDT